MKVTEANYIHQAFKQGDLETLLVVLDSPPSRLNTPHADAFGHCLEYAIYHSPLSLVRQLLERGADPNYEDQAGFPSLLAALTADRPDRLALIELLLERGADLRQRGINGFTPLHMAASGNDLPAVGLLLERGADPHARTGVDDHTTPLEEAEAAGHLQIIELLKRALE